jgi:peptidoglycan/LPS O-acetylase OafA/YrhL
MPSSPTYTVQTTSRARLAGLDVLRAGAVLLVMGRHMRNPPGDWPVAARATFGMWNIGGWVGVDLFFVLSGFLVSGLLFSEFRRHGRVSPLHFYARRAWKIYPPYFVMLAVSVLLIWAQGGEFERLQLIAEVLFFQNFERGLWNHTWSLAVEEHFYLLLPLVFLIVIHARGRGRSSLRPVLLVGALVAVWTLMMRVSTAAAVPAFSSYTHVFATQLRLDSLFFGVMLAYPYHFHHDRFVGAMRPWRVPLLVGGLVLLAPAFVLPLERNPILYTLGFSVLYVGSGMLLVASLLFDVRQSRLLRGAASMGRHSYSIYLWHMPVIAFVMPLLDRLAGGTIPYALGAPLYLGLSVAIGVAMARLIEVPALRGRDQRFPSRAAATAPARAPRTLETPVGTAAII